MNTSQPPRWADRFLVWYCRPSRLEQIQGDVHELYHGRLATRGERKARRAFVWDVLRFFRWSNLKRPAFTRPLIPTVSMVRNYLTIGWRNLQRQKVPSFINIFGLSCTIACCLVAYLFIDGYLLRDRFHRNKDSIYLLTHTVEQDHELKRYGTTARPLSEDLTDKITSLRRVVRFVYSHGLVKCRNESFSEGIQFADPSFFEVFTFPLKYGAVEALHDPQQVALSASVAKKLLGKENPLGEMIDVVIQGKVRTFTVGAVLEDYTTFSSLHPQLVIHYDNLRFWDTRMAENWQATSYTFVQIDETEAMPTVRAGLKKLVALQNEANPDEPYRAMQLEPLTAVAKKSNEIRDAPGGIPSLAPVLLLGTIALFMLTLSVFNYINIATMTATRRIREIGVRKVIGSRRSQLIIQFLSENLLICFVALGLGTVLASVFFLPWFNQIAGLNLRLNLWHSSKVWLFLTLLLLGVGAVSGAYPALYISSFKPTVIFNGAARLGSKSRFTSVLLSFQFALAVITVVGGLVFIQNNRANEQREWGYDSQSKLVINVPTEQDYRVLRNQLLQQPNVSEVAGSVSTIGKQGREASVEVDSETYFAHCIDGAANYPRLMGLRLAQGRFFDPALASDTVSALLVNQTLMRELKLSFPTEQMLTLDGRAYRIIGVVEDFHYHHFGSLIQPLILRATPERDLRFLTISVTPGTEDQTSDAVQKLYRAQVADVPYEGYWQDSVFDEYFAEMNGIRNVLLFTATLAMVLSAMGLFGLVSLNVSARLKDFGIRKVLGANARQLSAPVYRRLILLLLIGTGGGGVAAYFLVSTLLNSIYQYHVGIGIRPMLLAVLVLTGVVALTIGSQIRKVLRTDPVEVLRAE